MIEVSHVSKRFGQASVLEDISLTARRGEIYGLVGYNGVGKTTLMKLMTGIYRPDRGSITLDGQPVFENPEAKRQSFFMTEEATFFRDTSMDSMRRFYRGFYPGWSDTVFNEMAGWFGLDTGAKTGSFSKGMQRQAGLTMALASRSSVLYLDEAFDGLDAEKRSRLRDMLAWLASEKQTALVVSSHNLGELENMAHRIGVLDSGKLAYDGAVDGLKHSLQAIVIKAQDTELFCKSTGAELLDRRDDGSALCLLAADPGQAREMAGRAGLAVLELRPATLEEYFRKGRTQYAADWKSILSE